jgi:hypothetical protein
VLATRGPENGIYRIVTWRAKACYIAGVSVCLLFSNDSTLCIRYIVHFWKAFDIPESVFSDQSSAIPSEHQGAFIAGGDIQLSENIDGKAT